MPGPGPLVFETDEVLARVERDGDLFAPLVSLVQRLPTLAVCPIGLHRIMVLG